MCWRLRSSISSRLTATTDNSNLDQNVTTVVDSHQQADAVQQLGLARAAPGYLPLVARRAGGG